MTYDPIDPDADGAYDTNELTVNTLNGLDLGANIDAPLRVYGQTVFTAGPDNPVAQSNIVAWWPFAGNGQDVTAGDSNFGDTTDYSVTDNSGNVQFPTDGVINPFITDTQAAEFDTTNYLNLPNSVGAAFTQPATLMYWIKTSQPTQTGRTFRFRTASDISGYTDGFSIYLGHNSIGTFTPPANEWYHMCITKNSGTGVTYFNGNVVHTENGVSSTSASRGNIFGGNRKNSPVPEFDGLLDDFRIYNTALTQSEIQQIIENTDPN